MSTPTLTGLLFDHGTIITQKNRRKGIVQEVVFSGMSPTSPDTMNFRVRYKVWRHPEQEEWTTYQVKLPALGERVAIEAP